MDDSGEELPTDDLPERVGSAPRRPRRAQAPITGDEPDSGLDPVRTALLCELIQEIHEENGGAYTVITHDIMSARRVAEFICVLWKGRIVESGPAEELFNCDNAFVRQFLSGESQGRSAWSSLPFAAKRLLMWPQQARRACPHPSSSENHRPHPPNSPL